MQLIINNLSAGAASNIRKRYDDALNRNDISAFREVMYSVQKRADVIYKGDRIIIEGRENG